MAKFQKLFPALIISLVFFSYRAVAIDVLTSLLDLNCSESDSHIIACSYRPLVDQQITDISAGIQDLDLEIGIHNPYPSSDSVTAVLFVVDTSDPARQNVIEKNAEQIQQLADVLGSHHVAGLASFDKDLVVRAPVGSDKNAIASAARSLQAVGLTTELYRNIIKAIELLSGVNADRKVLFVFSDGQAEDLAYFHEDVINVARRHGVVINSLGFARSTSLSVSLQTLRRLSEESGGVYVESDINHELPRSFMLRPYANIDRGGQFIINLTSAGTISIRDPQLALRFVTSAGIIPASIPVQIPGPEIQAQPPEPVAMPPVITQPQPEVRVPPRDPEYVNYLLWYGVPGALVVLILLTLFTLFMLLKKEKLTKTNKVTYAEVKPLAYLITQDEKARSYPVTSSTWRIGRSQDNEMTVDDSSISRRHAEINRDTNGRFTIYDRGSTNGVFVNNRKITKHTLAEADIIEIGDVCFRFTEHPRDFQLGEDTAMIRTRAPGVS